MTYLESAAGLRSGRRTGLVTVTVAVLFATCLLLSRFFLYPGLCNRPA